MIFSQNPDFGYMVLGNRLNAPVIAHLLPISTKTQNTVISNRTAPANSLLLWLISDGEKNPVKLPKYP